MPRPERTCALTRRKAGRDDLVRLVASPDGDVVVDYRGKLPGRGVWIWPDAKALSLLERKKGLVERQLRARMDPSAIRAQLASALDVALRDGLALSAAAGALVFGQDMVSQALQAGRLDRVVLAADTADRTADKVRLLAGDRAIVVDLDMTAEVLGARVGRCPTAVVGVTSSRATSHLRRQLRRLADLG